jgi:hypothetical protein
VLDGVLLGRVSLENVNWNLGVRKMTDSGGLSWEAQEVLQKIKSFNRLPGAGIPLIQLNMRVGSAIVPETLSHKDKSRRQNNFSDEH